jgi:phosphatidylglycerol---prolipoprotein diacylglyceryl transferase
MSATKVRARMLGAIVVVSLLAYLLYFFSYLHKPIAVPQYIDMFGLSIRWYSICWLVGISLAYIWARMRWVRLSAKPEQFDTAAVWMVLFGFIGARFYHVVSSFEFYWHHPIEIVQVSHGGLSWYGAILGGMVGGYMAMRHHRWDKRQVGQLLNALVLPLLLSHIYIRIGNWFNYEALGLPGKGIYVPVSLRPQNFTDAAFFRPWFFYEQIVLTVLLIAFWRYESKYRPVKPGALFVAYIFFYSIARSILEPWRSDAVVHGQLLQNVWVSIGLALVSAYFYLYHIRRCD